MDLHLNVQPDYIAEDVSKVYNSKAVKPIEFGDIQLWREFQAGNEIAYATIYRNNVTLLYNYGLKLIKDKELVKDCIQDLFIEIWNRKHKLGKVKSIKSYLFKSIRRKLISESIKKRKTYSDIALCMTHESLVDFPVEWNLIEKQEFDQKQKKLKAALDKLTKRQKEIIHLKFYFKLSYLEITEVMSLSTKATYKLMGRAISFLRNQMSETVL